MKPQLEALLKAFDSFDQAATGPEADRLLEKGRTTMEKEKRKEIYARLWQIIADDQPYIFLWYPKGVEGVRERVGGLAKPGPAGLFLNIEKVFVTK